MRKSITALVAVLLPCTDALQLTRRQIAGAAAFGIVQPARADVPIDPFNSMCLGFGCNSPQGVDSPGAPAPTDEDSIPWKQALELIDARKVKSVEFDDVAMDKCWVVTSDGRFRVERVPDGRRPATLHAKIRHRRASTWRPCHTGSRTAGRGRRRSS